ncbi:10592_t:CDS:2 [Paraglomus occultum]|uniref:10592_t:CDS:1 n=1 Tax=Paraglomus occultum TaxID=144539 RepID=A0A9N9CXR1_9GLOM|nr:10592_t:CDS:2 [Paraglomus occultum]
MTDEVLTTAFALDFDGWKDLSLPPFKELDYTFNDLQRIFVELVEACTIGKRLKLKDLIVQINQALGEIKDDSALAAYKLASYAREMIIYLECISNRDTTVDDAMTSLAFIGESVKVEGKFLEKIIKRLEDLSKEFYSIADNLGNISDDWQFVSEEANQSEFQDVTTPQRLLHRVSQFVKTETLNLLQFNDGTIAHNRNTEKRTDADIRMIFSRIQAKLSLLLLFLEESSQFWRTQQQTINGLISEMNRTRGTEVIKISQIMGRAIIEKWTEAEKKSNQYFCAIKELQPLAVVQANPYSKER